MPANLCKQTTNITLLAVEGILFFDKQAKRRTSMHVLKKTSYRLSMQLYNSILHLWLHQFMHARKIVETAYGSWFKFYINIYLKDSENYGFFFCYKNTSCSNMFLWINIQMVRIVVGGYKFCSISDCKEWVEWRRGQRCRRGTMCHLIARIVKCRSSGNIFYSILIAISANFNEIVQCN